LIGVEPEIVRRAVANRVRVLIRRKSFRAPRDRGWVGGISIPWDAAIAGVSYRAIMRKGGMLRWRMKPNVSDIDARSYRHGERLNRPIEVLVIERILIVPHAATQVGYFVTHEPDPIGPWGRFDRVAHSRTSPSFNRRLLSMGAARRTEAESRRAAANSVLLVRSVVIHVALARMTLAPGVFVRHDVFRFGKIGGARILRRDQVTGLHQNAVRRYVMTMAGVIVRTSGRVPGGKIAGEWIDPGARTDAELAAV
jgi:hypothetical protein